jgi:hypothetical protein
MESTNDVLSLMGILLRRGGIAIGAMLAVGVIIICAIAFGNTTPNRPKRWKCPFHPGFLRVDAA